MAIQKLGLLNNVQNAQVCDTTTDATCILARPIKSLHTLPTLYISLHIAPLPAFAEILFSLLVQQIK